MSLLFHPPPSGRLFTAEKSRQLDLADRRPARALERDRPTRLARPAHTAVQTLSLMFLLQIFLKRRLSGRRHVGGCELVNCPGL